MQSQNVIRVVGAREHNLKNITVEIPRDKFVVITGLSGSGKSSLAFDTIFAEGQRRYVESLSAYARQFLGQMDKPDVDYIDGLSPAVSIDQKATSRNPRSTVGTVTEIYDYLRLLFARVGIPHCPVCGSEVVKQSAQEIVDAVSRLPDGCKLLILAPIIRGRKGTYQNVFDEIRKAGFTRIRCDGVVYMLDEEITLDRYKLHTIEAVVDRIVINHTDNLEEDRAALSRLTNSVETALKVGEGYLTVQNITTNRRLIFISRSILPVRSMGFLYPKLNRGHFHSTLPMVPALNARDWAANRRSILIYFCLTGIGPSMKVLLSPWNGVVQRNRAGITGRQWKLLPGSITLILTLLLKIYLKKK